jgi:hypothetical protein
MLPEVGSLRLGFISKAQDNGSDVSMDDNTATSSMASSRADANVRSVHHEVKKLFPRVRASHADFLSMPTQVTRTEAANVKLSRKYSVSLTDITTLSQDPNVSGLLGISD